MSDITIEVAQGADLRLDAASLVDVALEQGTDITFEAGTAQGPPGPVGAAQSTYVHEQAIPALVWTIDHSLGFWPDVIVYDSSGREAEGTVTNPSVNRTTLTFSATFAGTARLS